MYQGLQIILELKSGDPDVSDSKLKKSISLFISDMRDLFNKEDQQSGDSC